MNSVNVEWTAAFPPRVTRASGYAKRYLSVDEAIKRPVRDGGWERDKRPSIVLLYNPANERHLRAVTALESDSRFKAATYLFNCFRVDTRGLPGKPNEQVSLRAYSRKGRLLHETSGMGRLPRAYRVLDRTFSRDYGDRLSKLTTWLTGVLGNRAYVSHLLASHEKRILCEHCGGCNLNAMKTIKQLKARRVQYDAAIKALVRDFE